MLVSPDTLAAAGIGSFNWTAIGVFVTAASLIATVWIAIKESRSSRFAKGVDLLLHFEARFESPEFRQVRAKAAHYLQAGHPAGDLTGRQALADLLNFFETIAFMKRHRLVSAEMVWHSFATWLLPYSVACKQFIDARRNADNNAFAQFCSLSEDVERVEERESNYRARDGLTGPKALSEFLEAERALLQENAEADILPPKP